VAENLVSGVYSPQYRKDMDLLEWVQKRATKNDQSGGTPLLGRQAESWGCSAWKREGSRDTLLQPFNI